MSSSLFLALAAGAMSATVATAQLPRYCRDVAREFEGADEACLFLEWRAKTILERANYPEEVRRFCAGLFDDSFQLRKLCIEQELIEGRPLTRGAAVDSRGE